jgi:hypothetical protein
MARIERRVASTSWIDERLWSLTLPEVDHGSQSRYINATSIQRSVITGEEAYRFSNLLEAYIDVNPDGRITGNGFTDASRQYRAPSFFDIESEVFPMRRETITALADRVQYKQLVGCRTKSPEVIAEIVGMGAGYAISPVLYPIIGRKVGREVGRELVEEFLVFPPIWTELSLTIYADGRSEGAMLRHSDFPSNCFYLNPNNSSNDFNRHSIYDARSRKDYWLAHGWGRGNPWNIPNPTGWGDNRRASLRRPTGGSAYNTGEVRGSVALYSGAVHGGARRPGTLWV